MVDGADKGTFHALRLLRDVVDQTKKPIIIWAGAGVSKWRGYPSWLETAEQFHSEYLKFESTYPRKEGSDLIKAQMLPQFFAVCRRISQTRYHSKLISLFGARAFPFMIISFTLSVLLHPYASSPRTLTKVWNTVYQPPTQFRDRILRDA
jgi:hypothetical protein